MLPEKDLEKKLEEYRKEREHYNSAISVGTISVLSAITAGILAIDPIREYLADANTNNHGLVAVGCYALTSIITGFIAYDNYGEYQKIKTFSSD